MSLLLTRSAARRFGQEPCRLPPPPQGTPLAPYRIQLDLDCLPAGAAGWVKVHDDPPAFTSHDLP